MKSEWKWWLAVIAVAVLAYLPCLNNGFIADDFILLNRVHILRTNPFYLVEVTPEIFRVTSYIVIGMLKAVVGYDYHIYYAFNILLHALNSLLLGKLVFEITQHRQISILAAGLFAVFQAPHEAIMWIGAMNETLLGFFSFLTLLLWVRGRYVCSLIPYALALWSKESAVVMLLVIPLIELYRGTPKFWPRYLLLLIPTSVFGAAFELTLSKNFMLNSGIHAFRWHALPTLLYSFHHLLWPWTYIGVVLLRITNGKWPDRKLVGLTCAAIIAVLLPYMFVIYTYRIPSRQTYLASAVLVTSLAATIFQMRSQNLRIAFVASFVLFNISYIWIRNDSQMEKRAAPTTALLEQLKSRSPGPVRLVGFEYPVAPDMAASAAITVPGWHWDDVELAEAGHHCDGCVILQWDAKHRRYIERSNE